MAVLGRTLISVDKDFNPDVHFRNFVYSSNGAASYDVDDQLIWLGALGSGPVYWTAQSAYVSAVPEPTMYLLLLAGLLPLAYFRKRRR
jgi:hypothetical protein